MRTNLIMLSFLSCLGLFIFLGTSQSTENVGVEQAIPTVGNLSIPNDMTTGVRYVYIQFPGDQGQIVKLRDVSEVIDSRITGYSIDQEPNTSE